jgi:integrase
MPIENYKQKAQTRIKHLLEDQKISAKNKTDFKKYIQLIEVSDARIGIICTHLARLFIEIADVIGSMDDKDQVIKGFAKLRKNNSEGVLESIKNCGKAYVRWYNDGETPKGWKAIKSNSKAQKRKLKPEDMLTWEDGLKIISGTASLQMKAIIMTELDAGFRPSELIDLKHGDIQIKDNFAIARVNDGKTGARNVILFRSLPYIHRWLNAHPTKKKGDPLWISENITTIKPYNYYALRKRIGEIAKRAGVEKPTDIYNMRHSACYLSKMDNVNPELAARKFGHSVKFYTDTYARLSSEDDIKRYSKIYKVGKEQEEEETKPIICERCKFTNEPNADFCEECSSPLSIKAAMKGQDELSQMKKQMSEMQIALRILKESNFDKSKIEQELLKKK